MLLKNTDPRRSKKLSPARAQRLSRALIIALVTGVTFVPGSLGLQTARQAAWADEETSDGFVLRAPQNPTAEKPNSEGASGQESVATSEAPPKTAPAQQDAAQPVPKIAQVSPSSSDSGTGSSKQAIPLAPQGEQAQPIDGSWTKRSDESGSPQVTSARPKPAGPTAAVAAKYDKAEMLPPPSADASSVDQSASTAQQTTPSKAEQAQQASQPNGVATLPKAKLPSDGQVHAQSVAHPLKNPPPMSPGNRLLDGEEGLPELPPVTPTLSQQVRPLNRDGFQPVRQEGKWVTRDMQNRLAPLRDPEPLPSTTDRPLSPARANTSGSSSPIPVSPIASQEAGADAANSNQPAKSGSDPVTSEPIATLPQQPTADQPPASELEDGPTVQEWISRNRPAPKANQAKPTGTDKDDSGSQAEPDNQSATSQAVPGKVASAQLGDKRPATEHLSDQGAATDENKSTPSMTLKSKDAGTTDKQDEFSKKPQGAPVMKSINEPLAPGKLTPIDGLKLAPVPKGSAASKPGADAKQRALDAIVPKAAKPLANPAQKTPAIAGDLKAEASVASKPIPSTPPPTKYGALDYAGYPLKTIQVSRTVSNMRRTMERCLNYFYNRPESANGRSNWGMMHSVMVYGAQTNVQVGRKRYNAIAWIAGNNVCRGQRLLTVDANGIKARTGVGLQGHQGQFLAVLGMCNVPVEYPLYANGKAFTVADLIEAEQKACKRGEELTFTLIGLSHYLDTDASWVAADGQRWDFERLIAEELKQPVVGAACGGTHRLMGYAHALRKRRAEGKALTGQWLRAEKYIDDFVKYAFSLQNRDGSMSTRWFEGREDNGDRDRKIQTTGHLVEWLLIVLPDDQLQDRRLVAAVSFLARSMGSDLSHDWSIGPKGHALRSMAMYHQRIFRAGTPWIPTSIASRPVQRK